MAGPVRPTGWLKVTTNSMFNIPQLKTDFPQVWGWGEAGQVSGMGPAESSLQLMPGTRGFLTLPSARPWIPTQAADSSQSRGAPSSPLLARAARISEGRWQSRLPHSMQRGPAERLNPCVRGCGRLEGAGGGRGAVAGWRTPQSRRHRLSRRLSHQQVR